MRPPMTPIGPATVAQDEHCQSTAFRSTFCPVEPRTIHIGNARTEQVDKDLEAQFSDGGR